MTEVQIDIETARNKTGELRVAYKLTPEDFENLKALQESPHWKVYRALLIRTKDAHFDALLSLVDTNPIVKQMGMIAGLNLAINTLPVLCAEYNKAHQKKLEKDSSASVPFKRG